MKKILILFLCLIFCFSAFSDDVSSNKKDQMSIFVDEFFSNPSSLEELSPNTNPTNKPEATENESLGPTNSESTSSESVSNNDANLKDESLNKDLSNNDGNKEDSASTPSSTNSSSGDRVNDKISDKINDKIKDQSADLNEDNNDSELPSAGNESENTVDISTVDVSTDETTEKSNADIEGTEAPSTDSTNSSIEKSDLSNKSNTSNSTSKEATKQSKQSDVTAKNESSSDKVDLNKKEELGVSSSLNSTNGDTLLLSDVPIIYGDETFRNRIKERTGGKRDPIGLVLTGGSARALAHIGVLKYLEENGIVPDYIVSNSMGSIIAMLYAAGLSPSQILEIFKSVDLNTLLDFTIPINSGIIDPVRFESLIAKYLGEELRVESLQIPIMVVCEDLVSKRQVHIAEGDFYTVFTASYALPVYFSSVEYNDHKLIDGGIANIAPISVAYDYSDTVIVSTTFYSGKDLNLSDPITGLNTAIDIGKRREGVKELLSHPNAIWIRCDVEDFSFMEFSSVELMAEHGYESAKEKENEIRNLSFTADGVSTELLTLRQQYDVVIAEEFKKYLPYSFTGYRRFTYNFPIIGTSYDSPNLFNFKTGFSLGTGVRVGTGITDFNVLIALNTNLISDNLFIKPELQFNLNRQLLSSLRFSFNFTFDFTSFLYFQANIEERLLIKDSTLVFGLNGELGLNIEKDVTDRLNYLTSGYIKFNPKPTDNFALGLLLSVNHGTTSPTVDINFKAISDIILKNSPIGFTPAIDFTYMFKSNNMPTLLSYTASLKAYYINRTSPTVSEVILLNPIKAGVYIDYDGISIPDLNASAFNSLEAGLFVSTNLQIIGLNGIPMELFIGYKFLDLEGLRGGFRIPLSL